MELTKETTILDLPEHKTLVKVQQTDLTFFDVDLNKVEKVRLVGRLTLPQCKEYVKTLNSGNVFISKENAPIEFLANTVALLQLNQGDL